MGNVPVVCICMCPHQSYVMSWHLCRHYVVCLLQGQYLLEALRRAGAEIRQNSSHFPPQPLPPLLLFSLLAQQTWKLPPSQETSPQHPSVCRQMEGQTGTEQVSNKKLNYRDLWVDST